MFFAHICKRYKVYAKTLFCFVPNLGFNLRYSGAFYKKKDKFKSLREGYQKNLALYKTIFKGSLSLVLYKILFNAKALYKKNQHV